MYTTIKIKKLGLLSSFAIYIPAAILMYCLTEYLIPYLSEKTGQEPILFWFIVAGLGVIMHGGLNGPSFIAICFGLI